MIVWEVVHTWRSEDRFVESVFSFHLDMIPGIRLRSQSSYH